MKKIFLILLLFVCFKSFGQFPQGQSVSGPTYNYVFRGGVQSMKGFINSKYTDTTAANADYIDFYTGAQIYTTGDQNFWIRDTLPMRWTRLANFSELDGGYFYPNQTSVGTTTHDANYNNFLVNNLNISEYTAGVNGNYSLIHQDSALIMLYSLHNATSTSSQFEVRPDSIRLLPFHGQINIDSLRTGTSNDSVMVWNKQSGIVGYRNASSFGGGGGLDSVMPYNGLTAVNADSIKLGGFLTEITTIATGTYALYLTTSTSSATPLLVQSFNGGSGIVSTAIGSAGSVGVGGNTDIGYGISGYASSTGSALLGYVDNGGYPLDLINIVSSTNTILPMQYLHRETNGTGDAAAGIGLSIDLYMETTGSFPGLANQIISKFTNATIGNQSALLEFTGTINAVTDTLYKMGDYVNLTESSATIFAMTTIGTGKVAGGEIIVNITSNDATNFQSRTMRFTWVAVNKAGTTTITIGTPEEIVAVSSGTLTATITAVDGGSGIVQFKANAVSSLSQTTLRCSYQMSKNF